MARTTAIRFTLIWTLCILLLSGLTHGLAAEVPALARANTIYGGARHGHHNETEASPETALMAAPHGQASHHDHNAPPKTAFDREAIAPHDLGYAALDAGYGRTPETASGAGGLMLAHVLLMSVAWGGCLPLGECLGFANMAFAELPLWTHTWSAADRTCCFVWAF